MTQQANQQPTNEQPTRDQTANEQPAAREPVPQRRWYSDPLLLAILVCAFAADQISKTLIVRWLRLGESWPAGGFFRFTYAKNTGTAFGLFQDQAMILTIVSFVAVVAIIYFYRNAITSPLLRAALGLQLGGAFGNLLDRIRLGYVVDFIDVGPWPIFNLADSSIVVGIAILAWHFGFRRDAGAGHGDAAADSAKAAAAAAPPPQPARPESPVGRAHTTDAAPGRPSPSRPSGDPQV